MKKDVLIVVFVIILISMISNICIANDATNQIEKLQTSNQTMASQFNDYKIETNSLVEEINNNINDTKKNSEKQLNTLNERLMELQEENEKLVEKNQELIKENQQIIEENQRIKEENQQIKEERGIVYNISLSPELQQYTFEQSKKYNIPYELMLAVMYVESSYNSSAIHWNKNGTYDSGLMQINSRNKKWLYNELGITDFLNAKNSIDAGCFYFSFLFEKYRDKGKHYILMCYNAGEGAARKMINKKTYSTSYSREVMLVYDHLLQYKEINI